MTAFNLTCEAVESTLPDYLDDALEGWLRKSIEEHLGDCAPCSDLLDDLRNNARGAASLPGLVPELDVWPGIARRIGAPIIDSEPPPERAQSPEVARPIPLTNESPFVSKVPLEIDGASQLPASELLAAPAEAPPVIFEPTNAIPRSEQFAGLIASDSGSELTSEMHSGGLRWDPNSGGLTSEPLSIADDLPVETSRPLTVVREPRLPAATTPEATTPPAVELIRHREKRFGPGLTGLAAAALVLVTAGTTFLSTVRWYGSARPTNVAREAEGRKLPSNDKPAAAPRTDGGSANRGRVALGSPTLAPPTGELRSTLTVSAIASSPVPRAPEEVVYDKEINTLSSIMRRQKSELAPSTVTVIEKNLGALDSAIAQIRAALREDPNSALLSGQASRALEMKVELLRRAAMLRAST